MAGPPSSLVSSRRIHETTTRPRAFLSFRPVGGGRPGGNWRETVAFALGRTACSRASALTATGGPLTPARGPARARLRRHVAREHRPCRPRPLGTPTPRRSNIHAALTSRRLAVEGREKARRDRHLGLTARPSWGHRLRGGSQRLPLAVVWTLTRGEPPSLCTQVY